jgi:glycosyltransferase involved in cell wall biosynthesis
LIYFTGYKFWQKKAYKIAKELNLKFDFDIVHQLTQITFREPGYTWKLNIPFVWRPTGGTSILPRPFKISLSLTSQILEEIRTFSNLFQSKYVARIQNAIKKASLIYAFSREDAEYFSKKTSKQVKYMLDAGSKIRVNNRKSSNNKQIKGLWIGRLMERKAPLILLKAIQKLQGKNINIRFTIIGQGPLNNQIQEIISKYNLQNVEWIKQVPHSEIVNYMNDADFFVHTSLREATSNVIPEALSTGLPVICHDINGMSIAINDKCGLKVPLSSPKESIDGFCEAIYTLAKNNELLNRLQKGAYQRAKEISWDSMAETIANDYWKIIENT